jgi:hypothetical protein
MPWAASASKLAAYASQILIYATRIVPWTTLTVSSRLIESRVLQPDCHEPVEGLALDMARRAQCLGRGRRSCNRSCPSGSEDINLRRGSSGGHAEQGGKGRTGDAEWWHHVEVW